MFNYEDLLARLQNGETSESIADEMAKALNSAVKDYEDAKAKKIEEDAKAEREQMKHDHLQCILDDLADWFKQYYPDYATEKDNIDAETAIELIDSVKDISAMLKSLDLKCESKSKTKPTIKVVKTSDDIFNDFFKSMGW